MGYRTTEEVQIEIDKLDKLDRRFDLITSLDYDLDKAFEVMKIDPEYFGYTNSELDTPPICDIIVPSIVK